jgi:LacI family transcriptional regulator
VLFLPRRAGLAAQVAEAIRADIRKGQWREHLPGEHFLCDALQVSRTTLRKALAELTREGLLESSQGRQRRITARPRRPRRRSPGRVVGLLSGMPLMDLTPSSIYHLGELRRHLHDAGYELRTHFLSLIHLKKPDRTLESVLQQTRAACWVLLRSSRAMQSWFSSRRVPSIISGSRHEGISLPSHDVHFQAVCRHAAGILTGLGHRRATLLTPRGGFAGDLAGERGFIEGFPAELLREGLVRVVRHDGTPASVRSALDRLRNGPHPPTALLVVNPRHVLTAFSHLLGAGLRFPRDMSLVSRDFELFLRDTLPPIARYELDHAHYARQLARLVAQLAATGILTRREHLVVPRLARGETLAAAPR